MQIGEEVRKRIVIPEKIPVPDPPSAEPDPAPLAPEPIKDPVEVPA